jgi:hypothetical protein
MPKWLVKIGASKWWDLGWGIFWGGWMIWNIIQKNWLVAIVAGIGAVIFGFLFCAINRIEKRIKAVRKNDDT